jgi:hypothetical protein
MREADSVAQYTHLDILNKNDARPSVGVSTIPPESWSYPIARVLVGWGFAWVVSKLIGLVAPAASAISFYALGAFSTFQGLSYVIRELRLQRQLRREAHGDFGQSGESSSQQFPEGWTPARRRRGFTFYGLLLITVAALVGYFAPPPQTPWGGIWEWVVVIVATFGVWSIMISILASDERILSLLSRKPQPPRE